MRAAGNQFSFLPVDFSTATSRRTRCWESVLVPPCRLPPQEGAEMKRLGISSRSSL